jgi:hypothetical protein
MTVKLLALLVELLGSKVTLDIVRLPLNTTRATLSLGLVVFVNQSDAVKLFKTLGVGRLAASAIL